MKKATRRVAFFFLHCSYKPGSVSPHAGMMSVIYLLHESPHGSSVLPSIVVLGRAALRRWYTRTCSPQPAQPSDHPLTGGLLHHLLTLTYPSISPYKRENQRGKAVVFFCRHILSPISSTFRSEAPYAARTFLSCREAPATDRNSAFWLQKYKKKSKRPNRARRNGQIIKI